MSMPLKLKSILPLLLLLVSTALFAGDFNVPSQITAGENASVATSGSGEGTFYLSGPGIAIKRSVKLGEEIPIAGDDVRRAGRYTAILDDGSPITKSFYAVPGKPEKINLIARPSRVPVSKPDVVIGVAFVFDKNQNMVLTPTPVNFNLSVGGKPSLARTVTSNNGVAWVRTASGPHEGAAQFVASMGDASVRRVVQQVASDPCRIHMKAQRQGNAIQVETDPIRDCSGNTLPDGTIVTFTESGGNTGKSSVDARIKQGIAKAVLPATSGASISVASGVVLGNEVRVEGGRD
jgi:hypothetical protein